MSYYIRVICRSRSRVRRSELEAFILEGAYFDPDPWFEHPGSAPEQEGDWSRLLIRYSPEKRPIEIRYNVDDAVFREEMNELRERLDEECQDDEAGTQVRRWLEQSYQVVAFEVDREGATEDAWEMLDSLEAYIARTWDGIVYAPDDGFYDENLKKLCDLS